MANINPVTITTPHAAVIIWNYEERLGSADSSHIKDINTVATKIISTVSLISISTKKSKGEPVGKFELNLAPTKNWVSEITSGSWMCILMGRTPITQSDLLAASPDKVKFFGKVESVRFSTSIVDPEAGTRSSGYVVTGVDWAHIFENNVYIDPFIEKNVNTVGSTTYIDLFTKVIDLNNRSSIVTTRQNIKSLIEVLGQPFSNGVLDQASVVNRVAKVDYAFTMPIQVQNYFNFYSNGKPTQSSNIVSSIELITGKLKDHDTYIDVQEAFGYIDPASLRGINTLWQLIIDNSCQVLNETLTDLRWDANNNLTLALYNRIKPFSYKYPSEVQKRISRALTTEFAGAPDQPIVAQQNPVDTILAQVKNLISQFQLLKAIEIPLEEVIDFNAGTNWRDKFNFDEIKPNWQDFEVLAAWVKTVAQTADVNAFQREGFRPLIVSTKQFPSSPGALNATPTNSLGLNIDILAGWKQLLREWYFDTHKLLNGSMTIIGQNEYIQIGSNIRVPIDVLGRTHNYNKGAINGSNLWITAHVESVGHSFRVGADGARSYTTNISFVRGIISSDNGTLAGDGTIDSKESSVTNAQYKNTNNVVATSTVVDPDPQKLRGT